MKALRILLFIVLVPVLALAAMLWSIVRFFLMVAAGLLTIGAVVSLLAWAASGFHGTPHVFLTCALPLGVALLFASAAAICRSAPIGDPPPLALTPARLLPPSYPMPRRARRPL